MKEKLIKEFHEIANKGWIPTICINEDKGAIGKTFENELCKEPDDSFFPDYYDIEIKCKSRFSQYPISLFSLSFDGPSFSEINRLVDTYGYPDYTFRNRKVLKTKLSCVATKLVNNKYKFILEIDELENKIYLAIYNLNNELIEKDAYFYIDRMISHMNIKLNRTAVVYASHKKIEGIEHFRYYKMTIYKLKDNVDMIELIKKGIIEIEIISEVRKSGFNIGKNKMKNLLFTIKQDHLPEIFDIEYDYNYDIKKYYNDDDFQIIEI